MPNQKVRCGPHFHHIDWSPAGPDFAGHADPAESVLAVLGAPSGCRRKVEAWGQTGIPLGDVHLWLASGFTDVTRAGRLHAYGFGPDEAAAWQAAGFTLVSELYVLRRTRVRVEVAGALSAEGLTTSRIAACAGGGAPVERALAWHRTGLDCWIVELLREHHQLPDSIGADGLWGCPHCRRRLAPAQAGQHLKGQRCYQDSGRAQADGWVAVPDRWAPIWLSWAPTFRSRHYSYAGNRVQFWIQSPWGGVSLETVLAAITTWRRGHYCRWEVAAEAVMELSVTDVLALAGPPRLPVGWLPDSATEPLEVAA